MKTTNDDLILSIHVLSLTVNGRGKCLNKLSLFKKKYLLKQQFLSMLLFFSCNERDQNAKGCKTVDETPLEVDLVTQIDPARDLQRLHSLIIGENN